MIKKRFFFKKKSAFSGLFTWNRGDQRGYLLLDEFLLLGTAVFKEDSTVVNAV